MVAELRTDQGDEDVVDLDTMSLEELIRERAMVWAEINQIEAQLKDLTRVREMGTEYAAWRKRAQWALGFRRIELRSIGDLILVREKEAKAAAKAEERARRQAKKERNKAENGWRPFDPARVKAKASVPPEHIDEAQRQAAQRRAVVLESLQGKGGVDGLLLRVWVAFHHLKGDGDFLPDELTPVDRLTLQEAAIYLRDRYGKRAVVKAIHGDIAPEGAL